MRKGWISYWAGNPEGYKLSHPLPGSSVCKKTPEPAECSSLQPGLRELGHGQWVPLPPLFMSLNKSASFLLKKIRCIKQKKMILGGLTKFPIAYNSFCIKTFPALAKATTRLNGLMNQIWGFFSVGQERQWLWSLVGMCGLWRLFERLSTALGGICGHVRLSTSPSCSFYRCKRAPTS